MTTSGEISVTQTLTLTSDHGHGHESLATVETSRATTIPLNVLRQIERALSPLENHSMLRQAFSNYDLPPVRLIIKHLMCCSPRGGNYAFRCVEGNLGVILTAKVRLQRNARGIIPSVKDRHGVI